MIARALDLALVFALGAATAAAGQATPREVVARILMARDSADISTIINLAHPEAMEEFKRMQLREDSVFEAMSKQFPREVGSDGPTLRSVYCVRDRAEFVALPPAEVLRRWLSATMLPAMGDTASTSRPPVQHTVLGEVAEGDTVVHVV